MRRKLFIGALAVLGLLSILIISAIVYVRSGRLDQWLQAELQETLLERGIRSEIGRLSLDITGSRVELENIKLYDRNGASPFASVQKVAVQFSIVDYFKQKVTITSIEVVRPEIWIELDEKGRSNLQSLRTSSEPKKREEQVTYLGARVTVEDAKFNFLDRQRNLSTVLPDLDATFVPLDASTDRLNHKLSLTSDAGIVSYEGREARGLKFEIESNVKEEEAVSSADVSKLIISSDLGQAEASGRVVFKPLSYDFSAKATLGLAEFARVFSPGTPMKGNAALVGSIEGKESDYHFAGTVSSNSLAVEGYSISGLKLDTTLGGKGAEYLGDANARATAITGSDFASSGLRVEGKLRGDGRDLGLEGGFSLSSVRSGRITVSDLRARLAVDQSRVALSEIRSSVFGGRLTGSASIAHSGGQSNVNLAFDSIDLARAAETFAAGDVRVIGSARGTARLVFPGFKYTTATGRIAASFDAAVSAVSPDGADSQPVTPGSTTGQVELVARGRGFTVEKAVVHSAKSQLTATGTVDWNGVGSLDVSFRSEDMSEVYRAVDALGLIPERTKIEFEPSISGPGEFRGSIRGKLASPEVTGHLRIASVEGHGESLGSFEGDVVYERQGATPGMVRIENATLLGTNGSRAEFTLQAPLPSDNDISVKAKLDKVDLARVTRAALHGLEDFVQGGLISGSVDLQGLPGSRSIKGTADISLTDGEFNLPGAEGEEESSKKSVPEFVGKVTIADGVLKFEEVRMKIGDGTIAGRGSFNLDTYAYSINAEGKNIDLGNVSDAFSETTGLAGRADVIISGSGDWDEWSTSSLDATVQGQNVTLRGRSLGDARLVATTENGILKLKATGNLNDEPHEVTAAIDLRDRDNYPITAEVNFVDAELAPYLQLVSADLGSISGVATGNVKISGPLKDTDRISAVMNLSKLEFGGKITADRSYVITNQGDVVVRATPKELSLEPVTFVGEGTKLTVGGSLWRSGEAASAGSSGLSITGEFNLRLVNSFTQSIYATGLAQVQASVVGSLDAPQLTGFVDLKDVGLRVVDLPLSLARGAGQIRFTSNQALIERFTASAPGGGTITASGGAALSGLVPDRWRIEANADQVGIEFPTDTQTLFDAALVLQGNRRIQVLSGDIAVRRASYTKDVTVDELLGSGGPFGGPLLETGGGGGEGSGPSTTLDLRIRADNSLVVRNNLAEAVGSAYLTLRGDAGQPLVTGRVLLTRGRLEFRNGRHELTRGLITLPGRRGAEPTIDFQAEAQISGYRVITDISGTPSNPQVTLRSDPELPEGDVVSLILTGTLSGNGTTAAAATQSGQGLALSILSASLSETIGKRTQRLFGLRGLSIDPLIMGSGTDPTARLTISQRVTRDFTITYSTNVGSGPSDVEQIVLVEYRLSNRFSVVGFRNDRGDLGFDVRLRKRF